MKRKILIYALSLTLLLPILAACGQRTAGNDQTERVLRVATAGYSDEEYFRQQFTQVFEFANPNIKIEYVSTGDNYRYYYGPMNEQEPKDPFETLKEVMEGDNPPDIVMVDYNQLKGLIEENMLTQLDTLATRDHFDTSDMVPAVIDGLKKLGDNKLYALAPMFQSSALIYNKALFDEAGVNYPTNDMTWDETFDIARRLTKPDNDNPKYGFNFSTSYGGDLWYGMQMYHAPLQLRMWTDDGGAMTVGDSEQWAKVWETMARLQQDKITPGEPDYNRMGGQGRMNPFEYDDFLSGRLAMAVVHYNFIDQIINVNKNAASYEGFSPINWDVVNVPSHPEAPGVGGNVYMNGIMAINAKAQNPEDAWNLIKFINGEDWARLRSHSMYQMVSRQKYIRTIDGLDYNIGAFFKNIPAPSPMDSLNYRTGQHLYRVFDIGSNIFRNYLRGEIELNDALKEWQNQGDTFLQEFKNNPDGPDMGIGRPMPMMSY